VLDRRLGFRPGQPVVSNPFRRLVEIG
jgi:hypothetical protein